VSNKNQILFFEIRNISMVYGDADNDGFDETFVATAGGSVDANNPVETHLWSFKWEVVL
jgi:hypothetical protein